MAEFFLKNIPKAAIYLDNAASTPPHPELLARVEALWSAAYVNPSSASPASRALRRNIDEQTATFLKRIGAGDARVVWTSGGTEANNLAVFGGVDLSMPMMSLKLVTSTIEHPSIYGPLQRLEHQGAIVSRVAVDRTGAIDLQACADALTPETVMVAVGLVQGETGVIQDLVELRKLMDLRAPNARLHVDAVQALTKVNIPWKEARIDTMALSGHKIHAFGGVGALVVRNGTSLAPQILGGGQQDQIRSGSLDGAGICSFLIAHELLTRNNEHTNRISRINKRLRNGIIKLFGDGSASTKYRFISPESASPFILNVAFPNHEGAVLMRMLSSKGIIVSTGSACSAEETGPSKILTAMGCTRREAFGAIRFSFGLQNAEEDIDRTLEALHEAILLY